MKLSKEQVKHIALLSRLSLTEDKVEMFQEQLSDILTFVEKLSELDTKGIDPKFQIIPQENVLRKDISGMSFPYEKTFMNAPETNGKHFIVPKVVKK